MREKLIELLAETPGIAWSSSARQMVADHLIANGATIQKWIPVTERLPEEGKHVLVYRTDCPVQTVMEATLYNDGWLTKFDFDPWENDGITHWMPLPEPPKEGDGND